MLLSSGNSMSLDFSDGPVAKNPSANARDTGLIPGPGRFHMPQGNEACVPQILKPECSGMCALQQEKDLAQQQRPSTAKTRNKKHYVFEFPPYQYIKSFLILCIAAKYSLYACCKTHFASALLMNICLPIILSFPTILQCTNMPSIHLLV